MPIADDHPLRREIDTPDFADMPWQADVRAILDGIGEETSFRTPDLLVLVGKTRADRDFIAATNVLSSWTGAIFDARLFMIGPDGDVDLDQDDCRKVLQGDPVIHPVTREIVVDPASRTYVRYDLKDAAPSPGPEG